ncbi:NAD-dependent epimerase/dehydratase family protein [Parapedobacter lycopersici]|uniref:NAD-dependent epimerase/dehydratase family protein n=1 Tax=Parapedobacter lycopersici TaxID=1864939 RepID=UPI00333FC465
MMNVLIIGCGWVGTYTAGEMLREGHRVWGTTTSTEKVVKLTEMGVTPVMVNFDDTAPAVPTAELRDTPFDVAIISVPITYKDSQEGVRSRFTSLLGFLTALQFRQLFFFGSVGIYPKVSATITEDTFPEADLEPKLLLGESMLRSRHRQVNLLRLGGLFGLERVMAKHFVGKICEIGYQTANFVHVEDIYCIIRAMIAQKAQGKTYNVVSPEHPLKKDVIAASAEKYGYGLPAGYTDTDQTAKVVSPERLINDLDYRFIHPSPLYF